MVENDYRQVLAELTFFYSDEAKGVLEEAQAVGRLAREVFMAMMSSDPNIIADRAVTYAFDAAKTFHAELKKEMTEAVERAHAAEDAKAAAAKAGAKDD